MSAPLPPGERLISALAAVFCLSVVGWLAWGEWGPEGRATRPPLEDEVERGEASPTVARARRHVEARRWEDALEVLASVDVGDPGEEEASALRMRAMVERRNRDVFARLKRQLVDGDTAGAQKTLRTVPADSVYRADAARLVEGLK